MDKLRANRLRDARLDCKSERVLATQEFLGRMGDKWTILIVVVLAQREEYRARFSDLKRSIHGISQTMLTSTLRSLERDGIVGREIFPEVPPRVEYRLTEFGLSVLEPMRNLAGWVERNWHEARRSREAFDQKTKSL